jgi:hypothetical protein
VETKEVTVDIVWVVSRGESMEGSSIRGIFRREEDAVDKAKAVMLEWGTWEEYPEPEHYREGTHLWRTLSGVDYVTVIPHQVK